MSNGKRILVVDDDARIASYIEAVLKQHGYTVKSETDALKAVQCANEFKPDLVLLDVAMPDKDGGDIAREMRLSPTLENTLITFMTGIVSAAEVGGSSGALGNQEYLPKPVSPTVLINYVRQKLSVA